MATRTVEETCFSSSTTQTLQGITTVTQEALVLRNYVEGSRMRLTGDDRLKKKRMKRKKTTR